MFQQIASKPGRRRPRRDETFGQEPRYHGLRMTAGKYLSLPPDGFKYELVDGVVWMSPGATPLHQRIANRILHEIATHLERHPVGEVFSEVDVHLEKRPRGKDLVYRPDVVFVRPGKVSPDYQRLIGPPDVVVEIISREGERYDRETKGGDYERNGVGEYWLIDPHRKTWNFFRLKGKRYVDVTPLRGGFKSEAIRGFTLNLKRIRTLFV